jgi:flagellar biosynthetic protein FlhB
MAAEDKTEAPTPKRLRELREKGSLARSIEIPTAMSFLVAWMALKVFGESTVRSLKEVITFSFQNISKPDFSDAALMHMGLSNAMLLVKIVAPFALVFAASGLVSNLLQVGLHFSFKPLTPDFSRINPLSGAKRFFSMRVIADLIKSLVKLVVIGFVAFKAVTDHMPELTQLTGGDTISGLILAAGIAMELLLKIGLAFLVLALADYLFQRWQFMKNAKMTKQEIKEETRASELNEQIRGRIRSLQRQLARKRMMQRVPQADVVITNPTHYAVALQYDAAKMAAPRVVAKGQRLIAQQIKEIARMHGVPLVENKPLAQALFRAVPVDGEVPRELYKAVAEVLAFIYKLKNRKVA